jgi:CheY-like chemotaxis protein
MTELLHGTALDPTQRDYAETLKTAANGLLGLINDILDFSKIEAGRLELEATSFDPARLITDLVKLFTPQAYTKAISLTYHIATGIEHWVTGDPARLRQMLLNLLSNAVKFTDTGSVTISLERDIQNPRRLRFSVSDTGAGIPSHKHVEIFTEFSQVDSSVTRRYGGTGLGLAITHRLAVAMGSGVELESTPGRGSTFSFSVYLPAGEPAKEAALVEKPATLARPLRLLVVDDNFVNLKVATRLLGRLGCSSETASNGQEACDMITTGNYDAVLMDCMMPILDGYSAARRLRAAGIGIPILAMTANCQPEDVARCFESGMNAHLPKPIRLAELAAALAGLEAKTNAGVEFHANG